MPSVVTSFYRKRQACQTVFHDTPAIHRSLTGTPTIVSLGFDDWDEYEAQKKLLDSHGIEYRELGPMYTPKWSLRVRTYTFGGVVEIPFR